MSTRVIIQMTPYYYALHPGWLEKVADTLSQMFEHDAEIRLLTVSSDIKKWSPSNSIIRDGDVLLPSRDIISGFPLPKFRSVSFRKTLASLRSRKPTIVITHTRFFPQSVLWWILAKIFTCTRIHVEHGSWFVTGYPRYVKLCAWLFDRTLWLRIFRTCNHIITISEKNTSFIKKFTKKEPSVIYNPIDIPHSPKVVNETIHIGFIGRLVSLKGVHLLIQALSMIQEHPRTCTIVGDGPARESLENETRSCGISSRISFVGAVDRTARLPTFDILVNPSYQEGLPTTVVEGLMSSCIVVATDVGGTSEISTEDDLILIEPGNKTALQEWLIKAFSRRASAGASRDIVNQKFSLESAKKKYKRIFTTYWTLPWKKFT